MQGFINAIMKNLTGSGANEEVKNFVEKNMGKIFPQTK
jgi:hypothetical protein